MQSPSVSTVMTHHSAQPKPVWKKAPPGLQRPSRIATPSGWPSITPRYLTHTLDPALKAAGARVTVTIRLLKKDASQTRNTHIEMQIKNLQITYELTYSWWRRCIGQLWHSDRAEGQSRRQREPIPRPAIEIA